MIDVMPKDRVQRKKFVADMRRDRQRNEREAKARTRKAEFNEIFDNVDRAWKKREPTGFKKLFGGFGRGVRGSTGRYVFRGGRLVPK